MVFVSQGHFDFSKLLTLLSQDIFRKYHLFILLWILARNEKVTLCLKNSIGVVMFVQEILLGNWNSRNMKMKVTLCGNYNSNKTIIDKQ